MDLQLFDLGHLIKRLQYRHHRAANAGLSAIGVTLVQWDVLRAIKRCPDASAHQLAQLTFQTDQSFGALSTRMIAAELITRTQGPGRAFKHQLTATGAALLEQGFAVIAQVLNTSFSILDAEQRLMLHNTLRHLLEHHEEPHEPTS